MHAVMAHGKTKGEAPIILNFDIRWRWLIGFTLRPIYPWESASYTHCLVGLMGPTAGLDALEK